LAKNKGKYIRRIRRRNAIKITILLLIFLIGVFIVALSREKTMLLESETFIVSKDVQALFIKNEAVIYFGHDIVESQTEGTKVSKNTVLAEQLDTSSYAEYEKEIISNKLSKYMYDDKSLFLNDIINAFENSEGLSADKEAKIEERDEMLATIKYLFYTKKQLNALYDKYDSMGKSDKIKLKNTPIKFTGQVFYETDGYEDIAPTSVLSMLTPDYFDFIYDIKEDELTKRETMVVKVIDNSCIFVSFALPLETDVDYQTTVMNYKANVLKKNSLDYEDYHLFLKERRDLLVQFPKLSFEVNDKIIKGYFIDVKEFEDQKIITLCITKDVEDIIKLRIENIKVYAEQYSNVFCIPQSSVYINEDNQYCIDIIDKGKIRKTYAVTVRGYDEENGNILIDTDGVYLSSENTDDAQSQSEDLEDYSLILK
jgi:hypothetical protein